MHGKSINAEQFHSLMIEIIMQPTTTNRGNYLSLFNFLFIESIANDLLGDKNPFCVARAIKNVEEGKYREKRENNVSYCILRDKISHFASNQLNRLDGIRSFILSGGNAHQTEKLPIVMLLISES